MVPISVLGLALPWALLSETVGTARWVFQVNYGFNEMKDTEADLGVKPRPTPTCLA